MPTSSSTSPRACGLGARGRRARAQRLGHEVADRAHRVGVRARVLEDDRDLAAVLPQRAAAQRRARRARRTARVPARPRPAAGAAPTARAVIDLPEPDSPTRPTRLARRRSCSDTSRSTVRCSPSTGSRAVRPSISSSALMPSRRPPRSVGVRRCRATGARVRARPRAGTRSRRRTCGPRSEPRSARRCQRSPTARRGPGSGS